MKGQLLAWQRPYVATLPAPSYGARLYGISALLRDHGFVSGRREADRLLAQGHVWVDGTHWPEGSTVYTRMRRAEPEEWLYPGAAVFVGKNREEAACHRLTITEPE